MEWQRQLQLEEEMLSMRQCLLFLPPPLTPHSLLLTTMNLCNYIPHTFPLP